MHIRIGFIGCGNMGEALLKGLLDKKIIAKKNLLASDAHPSRRNYIRKRYGIETTASNKAVARLCDTIILAIKPQNMDDILTDIRGEITAKKLIITIAAGIKITHIQKALPECRVIRVMPNAPALIGCGITAICKSGTASKRDFNLAQRIFGAVGDAVLTSEKVMDVVTATSGSGPAYLFLLIDSMIKAAISLGLRQETARRLVLNTTLGAAALASKSKDTMDELIKNVASKGGTTEAALKIFDKRGFRGIIKEAMTAALQRSRQLSK